MSDNDILKWLAGLFFLFLVIAFMLSGGHANCGSGQYTAQVDCESP